MTIQPKVQVLLWGKDVELDVVFDCYEGEDVLPQQEQALQAIMDSWEIVDAVLPSLQHYIGSEGDIPEVTDVFEYVKPMELFVKRSVSARIVAIMCDFELDPEHGLAIVFENETFLGIVQEGDVL